MFGFNKDRKIDFAPSAPDFMPVLRAGAHKSPEQGACFMEYISVLAGEKFSDHPECVNPFIAMIGRTINDMGLDYREKLISLMGPAMATGTGNKTENARRSEYLETWCQKEFGFTGGWNWAYSADESIEILDKVISHYHNFYGTKDHRITKTEVERADKVGLPV